MINSIGFLFYLAFLPISGFGFYQSNLVHSSSSEPIELKKEISAYFNQYQCEGSITIYNPKSEKWIVSDTVDIYKATLPASTFKIINLLIALETKVIKDENTVVEFPGIPDTTLYGYRPDIYHSMSVKEAFEKSAGWVFSELSKKIGRERYLHYLKACNYGNNDLFKPGPDFWNYGPFGISPVDQVVFLKKVYYEKDLPFSKRNIEILKKVMITEETEDYTISAKTGWTLEGNINTGWWVGYVESSEGVNFFATRIVQRQKKSTKSFGPSRKEITKSVLKDLKMLP